MLLFNYNEYNLINIFAFFLFFYFTHGFDNCMWIQLHSFSLISQWCNTSQLIQHEQPLCNTFCMVTCSLRIYTFENDHCCFKSIVVTPVASQFNKTLQTYSHWNIWSIGTVITFSAWWVITIYQNHWQELDQTEV